MRKTSNARRLEIQEEIARENISQSTPNNDELDEILMKFIDHYIKTGGWQIDHAKQALSQYIARREEEAYRYGYNDNARDCLCEAIVLVPHHHLLDDENSYHIKPHIQKDKYHAE